MTVVFSVVSPSADNRSFATFLAAYDASHESLKSKQTRFMVNLSILKQSLLSSHFKNQKVYSDWIRNVAYLGFYLPCHFHTIIKYEQFFTDQTIMQAYLSHLFTISFSYNAGQKHTKRYIIIKMCYITIQYVDGVTGDVNTRQCAHASWHFLLFFARQCAHHSLFWARAFDTPATFHQGRYKKHLPWLYLAKSHLTYWIIQANQKDSLSPLLISTDVTPSIHFRFNVFEYHSNIFMIYRIYPKRYYFYKPLHKLSWKRHSAFEPLLVEKATYFTGNGEESTASAIGDSPILPICGLKETV